MNSEAPRITLEGQLVTVIFFNETNGYGVIRILTSEGEEATLTGAMAKPSPGELVRATGVWTTHTQFGQQFKADRVEIVLPGGCEGIRAFLAGGAVKGIGRVMAERLVARFGEDTLSILRDSPLRLAEIPGISKRRAEEMGLAFRAQDGLRQLMAFFVEHDLPTEHVVPLYRLFGDDALLKIQENPYMLAEPPYLLEFSQVDALALGQDMEPDDNRRVSSAILYELRYNLEDGHAFLPVSLLAEAVAQLIAVQESRVAEILPRLADVGLVFLEVWGDRDVCYLAELFEAERSVARRLCVRTGELPAPRRLDALIGQVEAESGLSLAPQQREALFMAATRRAMLLTGGPGTGKTTSLRAMISLYERLGLRVLLAAPTGRAAKRMSELTGREARTIHRLLEVDFDEQTGQAAFVHNENAPLDCDAVIIDEMSMVDILLMRALVAALKPETRLIMVGDPNQLPSVGPGHVLHDLLASHAIPVVRLTEVFRQARESHIVLQAHAVNRGRLEPLRQNDRDFFFLSRRSPDAALQTILELCAERLPNNLSLSPAQIQVISPTRRGVTGTRNLNLHLQERLNPPKDDRPECRWGAQVFRQGDRVMQIRNNYDLLWRRVDGTSGLGVFNGDVGLVLQVDAKAQELVVLFDDRTVVYPFDLLHELDMAYAMTVHKAQGSEYDAVVLAAMPAPSQLMTRRVLYTAITRACRYLIIVGREDCLETMIENSRDLRRYSGLARRMRAEWEAL